MADIAPKLVGLSAEKLIALHKRVHLNEPDAASIEVHHTILNEMGRRGMELPEDNWNQYEILVDSLTDVDLTNLSGLPADTVLDVIKTTGDTVGNVKTFFTATGYQLRVEPVEKTIRQEGDEWVVYNEEGTRKFGSYQSKEEAEKRLRQIESFSKADDTYTPPKSVREAAQRAITWIGDGFAGQGFTSTGRVRAGQLARGEAVSIQTLKRMKSFFSRHEVDKKARGFNRGEEGFPSAGRVAWDAWGGDAGFAWAEAMVSRYENAEKVEKHGDHDQSSHGAWATGQGSQEVRERRAKSGKVPGMTRDASGNVSNPDATGGHKAKIPREVSIGKDAKGNDIMIDESHSMWHHMVPDGKGGFEFSEERQALHEQIIDELVSGVPKSENPTLYMLGGGPASGKSTFLNSGATDVPSGSSAVQINADTIKERLPEYERMVKGPDSDFFNAAQFSHEESSMLAKEVQRRAIALGKDIVLDGTGDSAIGKLASKVEQARQQGYTVTATYVTIPTETAVERANKRALGSSARYVPSEIVRETHRAVSDTFDLALKGNLFDSVTLWDNTTKGAPKLLATGNTKGYEIKDQAGYKSFLDKRDEKK